MDRNEFRNFIHKNECTEWLFWSQQTVIFTMHVLVRASQAHQAYACRRCLMRLFPSFLWMESLWWCNVSAPLIQDYSKVFERLRFPCMGQNLRLLSQPYKWSLDCYYTRLLHAALNSSLQFLVPNEELYGTLSRISDKEARWRLGVAGQYLRQKKLLPGELVLWERLHEHKKDLCLRHS